MFPRSRQREAALSSREKKQCCLHLADGIAWAAQRSTPDLQRHLPAAVETLLQLADDGDADVRTAADESLNRIVRVRGDWRQTRPW